MDSLSMHHVGVAVDDVERVSSFYRDTFGFDETEAFDVAGEAFGRGIGREYASGAFVRLALGDVLLELVEYESSGRERDPQDVSDPGSVHIALECDDVHAFYDDLDESVAVVNEPVTTESGTTILFVRDPEGNLVEVLS